jgi:hypothetical protein
MEKSFDTPREKAIKILIQAKQWILSVVTYRFSLKSGEVEYYREVLSEVNAL